nr:MAG TPA: hypothetical protein [Ackermannviridae sp.]
MGKIEMRFVKMTIWIVIMGTIEVVRRLAIITNRRLTQKIISRKNINFNIEVEP